MKAVSRRDVIKTFVFGAVCSSVVGRSWAESFVAELQLAGGFSDGVLRVDLNEFPALAEPYGSIRIGTFPIGADRRTEAWLKPIIINRGVGEELYVLSSVCSHEGCILPKMDSDSRLIICREDSCGHGSQFEVNGAVRQGPANNALSAYSFTREGSVLTVRVPELFYDVTFSQAAGSRVRVRFVAFYQTRYEVYFRESLDGPAELVSFSLTENGEPNLTEIVGDFDSVYADLFLERPGAFGFFQVAVKTGEV